MPPRRRYGKRSARSSVNAVNDDFAEAFASTSTSPPPPPTYSPPPPPPTSKPRRRSRRQGASTTRGGTRRGTRRRSTRLVKEGDNDEGVLTEAAKKNDNTNEPKGVSEDNDAEETVRDAAEEGGGRWRTRGGAS